MKNIDPSPREPRRAVWITGGIVAILAMGLLYGGICLLYALVEKAPWARNLFGNADSAAVAGVIGFGLPSFILIPMLGGVVASYFWRVEQPGIGKTALGVLATSILALGGAAVILREGAICLLIVAPLFFLMVFVGALLGRIWFRYGPNRMHATILPLVALLAFGEPAMRSPRAGVVVDEIRINAPPAKVWPQLTSFPAIAAPPKFWMFQIGLPYPVETTSQGDFVGAGRQCIFSDNMVFDERVAVCVPGAELTFDITSLPQHPELIGHLTPSRGQFLLRDNGDGTTTLVGSTWYTLHVRPLWYFDWWTHRIFRAVHLRVMEDIRERAERG